MARLQQANPSPKAEAAMAYLRVATTLVEEKSVASKSAASSWSRHSRSSSNRPAHNKLHTIQEEVDQHNPNQPWANGARDSDLHANLDKNTRGRDAHSYNDQCHRECEEQKL
jgi:hypothetical protein